MKRSGSKNILESDCYCKIRLLDDSEISCEFKKDSKGSVVFDQCCKELDLLEKDYFGLRYVDTEKQRHWLDINKNLIKQMKSKPPYTLFFRVKFYPQDPSKVVEEITRYHLFVQVKRDILHGRLLCSFNDLADLGGYIVQDELGDYDADEHKDGYLSDFRIVPKQNEKLELKITENHRNLSGLTPSDCEKEFLEKVKLLEMYGVDPHPCKDQEGIQLYLGLTPEGIAIIREAKKVSGFPWSDVLKVSYDSKVFYVQVQKEERKANYGFRLPDHGACKHLWKCAIEHHTFYSSEQGKTKVKRRPSMSPQRIFKRHSYHYSGLTQDQVIKESEKIQRPHPDIKRTPSIRIFAKSDMVKKPTSVETHSNNNSSSQGTPSSADSSNPGNDPLHEFETEHIPDVPKEDAGTSSYTDLDHLDGSANHVGHDAVAEVGSGTQDTPGPRQSSGQNSAILTFILVLLIIALFLIPVAVVVQSNKDAIKHTTAFKSFDRFFHQLTGVHPL